MFYMLQCSVNTSAIWSWLCIVMGILLLGSFFKTKQKNLCLHRRYFLSFVCKCLKFFYSYFEIVFQRETDVYRKQGSVRKILELGYVRLDWMEVESQAKWTERAKLCYDIFAREARSKGGRQCEKSEIYLNWLIGISKVTLSLIRS